MLRLLASFAALSMAGTLLLSLLPEGGMKRTASLVIGLLTLMCWTEGIAMLFDLELQLSVPNTVLTSTHITVDSIAADAAASLLSPAEAEQ